ncbi:MAG TPA: CdaR family protein [Thermoanaerobaculia bacterium]|nr:CdaR family protein [Thermoanaerobaculia bacterium]
MMRNLGPRLTALAIAAVIWLIASEDRREEVLERNFQVPLALVGVPSNLVISGEVEDAVTVRLRGPASQVRGLTSENLEATVDLTDSQPGTLNVSIPPTAITLPRNVEVISMQPARVRLQLEPRRQKVVVIRPYLVGAPADGFVIEGLEAQPGNALIAGPSSLVEEVTEIPTERVILTGRNSSFRETVGVMSDIPLVRVVEPESVDVIVTIAPQRPPDSASIEDSPQQPPS